MSVCTHRARTCNSCVAGPAPLALGALAGLYVGRLEELAIALESNGAAEPGPVTANLRRAGRHVSVTMAPVAARPPPGAA